MIDQHYVVVQKEYVSLQYNCGGLFDLFNEVTMSVVRVWQKEPRMRKMR